MTLSESLLVVVAALLLGRLEDGAPLRQHLLDVLLAVAARQLQRGEAAVVGQVDIGAAARKKGNVDRADLDYLIQGSEFVFKRRRLS